MITPENKVPLDDAQDADKDDQQSQQDIHSNGFTAVNDDSAEYDGLDDGARLDQASKASEAAFTLDLGKGIAPKAEKKAD